MGNFVYTKDGLRYNFADGYNDGTIDGYHYYIRDHQGNNRVVAKYDGTIEQTTHYYPYGGILSQSTNQGVQKFKYNGKEFDTMHGLNMYDYGARQQDPATGMFTSMDPLCEKYYNISPYSYCAWNPISGDIIGGFTQESQNIIMNYSHDNKMNRIHEIFHTFGLEHSGDPSKLSGIMKYPPQTPNQQDANNTLYNPYMSERRFYK